MDRGQAESDKVAVGEHTDGKEGEGLGNGLSDDLAARDRPEWFN